MIELVEKLRSCFFGCSYRGVARSRLGGKGAGGAKYLIL